MITGAYIRIKRDDKWQNFDIGEITPEELKQVEEYDPGSGWKWARFFFEQMNRVQR